MAITIGDLGFDGPVAMDDWTPPNRAGVYVISMRADAVNKPSNYTIVYVGESGNMADRGFFRAHHKFGCWLKEAGSTKNVFISCYLMPQSTEEARKSVETKLINIYRPRCNDVL